MKKHLLSLIFVIFAVACLPDNYTFKENPIYILKEALNSLEKRDAEQFVRISGKEALCLYANDNGIQALSDNFPYTESDLSVKHQLLDAQFNEPVKFVGYWSYRTERHLFNISEKASGKKVMNVLIDCDFGNEGEKLKSEDQRNDKKYTIKKCRLVKVIPETFSGLQMPSKCESLRVNYAH